MRIGIDGRWIFPKISGIGEYTRRLIEHLAKIDKENRYFIFINNSTPVKALKERAGTNFSFEVISFPPNSFWNLFLLKAQLKRFNLDIYHSPNFFAPLNLDCKLAVTLHDLIPFLFPHFTPRAKKVKLLPVFKWILKKTSLRADKIITVSKNSRKDLLAFLKPLEDKTEVIYNGVNFLYGPKDLEEMKNKLKKTVPLNSQVFLFVGRFDPYKNITGLINSFKCLKGDFPELKLVIVGEEDSRYPEAKKLVKNLNLGKEVIFTGYLRDEELLYWYNRSTAFVLPSFYEGFGLPVVEAFACGCVVITSNVASLLEVAADAAILVNPYNQDELTNAMRQSLTDAALRKELREKGLVRAKLFSWERTARAVLRVYQGLTG